LFRTAFISLPIFIHAVSETYGFFNTFLTNGISVASTHLTVKLNMLPLCCITAVTDRSWINGHLVCDTQCYHVSTESCYWTLFSFQPRDLLWWTLSCNYTTTTITTTTTDLLPPPWTMSRTTWVSRNQKIKTRKVKPIWIYWKGSKWQWHQLGHMQICISPQTDNHASLPPLSFLQARCYCGFCPVSPKISVPGITHSGVWIAFARWHRWMCSDLTV